MALQSSSWQGCAIFLNSIQILILPGRTHQYLLKKRMVHVQDVTLTGRIMTKNLNYRNRDTILKAAREKVPLKFENHTITIYPDYTKRVQESRKSFLSVKQKLRAMDIKYMLLYPARLRVIYNGQSHFFEQPEEVWQWLDMTDQTPVQL